MRGLIVGLLVLMPLTIAAKDVHVRVIGAADIEAFDVLQFENGLLTPLDFRRNSDGADAHIVLDLPCDSVQLVVRGDGVTSPLIDIRDCADASTTLRPSAVLILTGGSSGWQSVAVERCDERRPEQRRYPFEVKPGERQQAFIEAGCVIPTLYTEGMSPEPLARFTIAAGGSHAVASPSPRAGGALRVLVVRDGSPLEKASVEVHDQAPVTGRPSNPIASGTTDENGEVRLSGIAAGTVALGVTAPDAPLFYSDLYTIEEGTLVPVEFESRPPASLTVRLTVGDEWEPILESVSLSASAAGETPDGDLPPAERRLMEVTRRAPAPERVAPGVWRWGQITPGDWRLHATAVYGTTTFSTSLVDTEIAIYPGEQKILELDPEASMVTGRIRTPARDFSEHSLRFEPYDRDEELSHAMVPIKAGNAFHVLLLPGTYRVGFNPKVGSALWFDDEIEIGEEASSIVLDLPEGRLSGTVVNGSGDRMAGCAVSARLLDAEHRTRAHQRPVAYASTDQDGTYALEMLQAGTWEVKATCGGVSEPRIVSVAEAVIEGVDLVVMGTRYTGTIRTQSGSPVAEVTLEGVVLMPGNVVIPITARSDASGRVTIFGPENATGAQASLKLRTPGRQDRRARLVLQEGFEIIVPD